MSKFHRPRATRLYNLRFCFDLKRMVMRENGNGFGGPHPRARRSQIGVLIYPRDFYA